MTDAPCVIGIDVGGRRKGFHAVALRQGAYVGQLVSGDVQQLSHWCRVEMQAQLIAIDAPSHWSADGRARPCERALNHLGIRCFASPTRAAALAHPSDYYGWMLQGEALYAALEPSHPLLTSVPCSAPSPGAPSPGAPSPGAPSPGAPSPGALPASAPPATDLGVPALAATGPACFETFPHAITWMLLGGQARAADKRRQRRALLIAAGIDPTPLRSIDHIDAALCALVAQHLASGLACLALGEPQTGLIVVPHQPDDRR